MDGLKVGVRTHRRDFIQGMHRGDDAEVKQNNKDRKLPEYLQEQAKEMIEVYREDLHKKYGYYPEADEIPIDAHRSHTPIDAPVDAAGGATVGDILPDETVDFYEYKETPTSVMAELIETDLFDGQERALYRFAVSPERGDRKITNKMLGEAIGTSGQYAGRVYKRMQQKLKEHPRMRRFYRF